MREILFRGKTTKKELPIREFNEIWVYGDLIKSNGKYYIHPQANKVKVESEIGKLICMHEVIPETVGQFTGLTDKNGKKIFEGDIVKCKHTIRILESKEEVNKRKKPRRSYGYEPLKREDILYRELFGDREYEAVYWRNYVVKADISGQRTKLQNGSDWHFLSASYVYYHELEVIGNIHDNPELLESE